jgi:DNA-directed RNA polymerase subunit RPC12/RpoP
MKPELQELGKWACDKCGERFDEPIGKREKLNSDPEHYETFSACPACGSVDVEEVES